MITDEQSTIEPVEADLEAKAEPRTDMDVEVDVIYQLNQKVDELLVNYQALKQRNKELAAENDHLHTTLSAMYAKQVSAGNQVASLVQQLRKIQGQ